MIKKPAFIQRRPSWHFQLRLQSQPSSPISETIRVQVDKAAFQGETGTSLTACRKKSSKVCCSIFGHARQSA